MLVLNLMISQYRLKLGKFYCIGVKKEVDKLMYKNELLSV